MFDELIGGRSFALKAVPILFGVAMPVGFALLLAPGATLDLGVIAAISVVATGGSFLMGLVFEPVVNLMHRVILRLPLYRNQRQRLRSILDLEGLPGDDESLGVALDEVLADSDHLEVVVFHCTMKEVVERVVAVMPFGFAIGLLIASSYEHTTRLGLFVGVTAVLWLALYVRGYDLAQDCERWVDRALEAGE